MPLDISGLTPLDATGLKPTGLDLSGLTPLDAGGLARVEAEPAAEVSPDDAMARGGAGLRPEGDGPSEFSKGLTAGVEGMKATGSAFRAMLQSGPVSTGLKTLEIFDSIDRGDPLANLGGQMDLRSRQAAYMQAPPERRAEMRAEAEQALAGSQEFRAGLIEDWRRYSAEATKSGGRVPNASDVTDVRSFMDWLGFSAGQVAPSLATMMATTLAGGMLGGPPGAVAGAVAPGYALGSGEIMGGLLEKGVDRPDVAALAGVPAAALEVAGGAPGRLVRQFAVPRIADEIAKGYVRRLAGELPKSMGEEAAVEGLQQAWSIAAQNGVTGEAFWTDENIKSILNNMAVGAVGGGLAAPVTAAAPAPRMAPLTPEDRASPLPDDAISRGKAIIDDALAGKPISTTPSVSEGAAQPEPKPEPVAQPEGPSLDLTGLTPVEQQTTAESPGPEWRPLYSDATRAEQIGWTNPATGEARMIEMPQPAGRPEAEQAAAAPTVSVPADQAPPTAEPTRPLIPGNEPRPTASWAIREKATGEVVMETFDRRKVDALNTEKYEAVPIQEYLGSINGQRAGDRRSPTIVQPDQQVALDQQQASAPIDTTGLTPAETASAVPMPSAAVDAPRAAAVDQQAAQIAEPTEAQKEAGNYRKGHTRFAGLDITVETGKGQERRGTDPDGKPWSVTMPAHYGYIRRTEGADGDHVDVYLGDGPETSPVWVIDQVDADTKAFDEHKVIMGVPSRLGAESLYLRAFSDGRGRARLGAIRQMTADEFKVWLRDGDQTKPAGSTAIPQAAPQTRGAPVDGPASFPQPSYTRRSPDTAPAGERGAGRIPQAPSPGDEFGPASYERERERVIAEGSVREQRAAAAATAADYVRGERKNSADVNRTRSGAALGPKQREAFLAGYDAELAEMEGHDPPDVSRYAGMLRGLVERGAGSARFVANEWRKGRERGPASLREDGPPTSSTPDPAGYVDHWQEVVSRIDGITDRAERIAEADAWLIEKDVATFREHIVVLDADGRLIQAGTSGQQGEVGFSGAVLDRYNDPAQRLFMTHNHPAGSALSVDDIARAGGHAGIEAIRVVAFTGARYTVRVSAAVKAKAGGFKPLLATLARIDDMLAVREQKAVLAGNLDAEEARLLHAHARTILLHRVGLITYESSSAPSLSGAHAAVVSDAMKTAKLMAGSAGLKKLTEQAYVDPNPGLSDRPAEPIRPDRGLGGARGGDQVAAAGPARGAGRDGADRASPGERGERAGDDADEAPGLKGPVARQTDTPAFRRWFGESKAVDRSGEPLVVYHGAPLRFSDAQKILQEAEKALVPIREAISAAGVSGADIRDALDNIRRKVDQLQQDVPRRDGRTVAPRDFVDLAGSIDSVIEKLTGRRGEPTSRVMASSRIRGGRSEWALALESTRVQRQIGALENARDRLMGMRNDERLARHDQRLAEQSMRLSGGEDIIRTDLSGRSDDGYAAQGAYFTPDANEARQYADQFGRAGRGHVYDVYLSLQNPFIKGETKTTPEQQAAFDRAFESELAQQRERGASTVAAGSRARRAGLEAAGFDGEIRRAGPGFATDEYIAFYPEQIKSASENVGTFDPDDPNILREDAPRFDIPAAERRAVSRLTPQDRALIEQHLAPAGGGPISRLAKSALMRDIARNGIADTLVTQLVNQLNPIFAYEMRAETAAGRTPAIRDASVSAAKMAEFTMNSSGRTWAMFHVGPLRYNAAEGIVEADGTGKGLYDIFKYLSDPDAYDKFRLYASARRGQRMMTEGRERNLTQAAIDRGLAMADDVGTHKGEARTFREIFDDYQAFNAALLNGMGRDTGLLSQEAIDLWLEHADYVPFYREIDEGEVPSAAFLRKNINKPDPGIKTLEGGRQRIADLMDNVARNAEAIVRAGMRNVTMRRIYELAEMMGEGQIVQEGSAQDGVLTYRVNGREVKFTVDDPALVAAVAAMRPEQHSGLYKALVEIASFFRNGIVASPAFMLRNLIRGTTAGFVQTGKNIGMAGWAGTGLVRALRNDRTIQEMKAISGTGAYTFGGAGSDIGAMMRRQTGAQRDLMPIAVVRKTWGVLEKFGEATELADREAIYSNLIREGKTKAEAAYQAMNLINYSRRGASQSLRVLLPLVPFLNARIQGLYRMAETQTTGPERTKKLMGVAARGLVLTGISMALYALQGDDDRYDDEPLHRKLNYYILYAGDTRILIPKAFEFGAIFSTLPELVVDAVAQKEGKRLAEGLAHTLLNTFAFNPIPQPALPILENIANYSFFTGREIENQRLQNLPAAQRYTAATPRVLREVGRQFNLSPVKMENLIRGYTGTMGMSLLAGLDSIGRAAGAFPSEPTGAFGNAGIFSDALEDQIGSMVRVGPDRSSRWVGDLYEMSRDVNQAYREAKSLAAEGDVEAARRLAVEEGVGARKFLNRQTRALGDLNKLIRQVEDDPTLSGMQKRAQLNRLYERRNTIAEQAVKAVKAKVPALE